MSGDVRLVDATSNQVVAEQKGVKAADGGMKNQSTFNGIPIGAVASLVRNIATSSDDQLSSAIGQKFGQEVRDWLAR